MSFLSQDVSVAVSGSVSNNFWDRAIGDGMDGVFLHFCSLCILQNGHRSSGFISP